MRQKHDGIAKQLMPNRTETFRFAQRCEMQEQE
jgi:hypothetical protein